jgi:hypothetical protein
MQRRIITAATRLLLIFIHSRRSPLSPVDTNYFFDISLLPFSNSACRSSIADPLLHLLLLLSPPLRPLAHDDFTVPHIDTADLEESADFFHPLCPMCFFYWLNSLRFLSLTLTFVRLLNLLVGDNGERPFLPVVQASHPLPAILFSFSLHRQIQHRQKSLLISIVDYVTY